MSKGFGSIEQSDFNGMRTDRGKMFTPQNNFYSVVNFNFDSLIGANRILNPEYINGAEFLTPVNGIFKYGYIDSEKVSRSQDIKVVGNIMYKDAFDDTPIAIYEFSGSQRCTFSVFRNILIVCNGIDYPVFYDGIVCWQMGAPRAELVPIGGGISGTYFYACTYITDAGEEYIGTISNTIESFGTQIHLTLPIGYLGTNERKIYRTKTGGTDLFYLATIADNETLDYYDTTPDGSLGSSIIVVNNECPKPQFSEVNTRRLVGCVNSQYQTQIWVTDSISMVWDLSVFQDTANISKDSSAITGMTQDYNKVIIGTKSDIYYLDVTTDSTSLTRTRANVGVANGFSMTPLPQNGNFDGGVFYLSSLGDIRLFNGNFQEQVPSSLDNLKTDNYSQAIHNFLSRLLSNNPTNIYGVFYDYKYHLVVGQYILFFDIRIQAWGAILIQSKSYTPYYNVLSVFDQDLYGGQLNNGSIDKFYQTKLYQGEAINSILETGQLVVSDQEKMIDSLYIYFITGPENDILVTIVLDGDYNNPITCVVKGDSGSYQITDYSQYFYTIATQPEDYRRIYINRRARWVSIKMETEGYFFFRKYKLTYKGQGV